MCGGGGSGGGACFPVNLPALPARVCQKTATFRRSHWSFIQSKIPRYLPFFLQCYSFLLNPPSFYPHFLTPHRAILPFRPLLHAPIALQQPRLPPSTCPSPPALSFLRLGHDRPSKPAHRRICLRLCPKRAYPFPCPDAEANMPPWVLHRTP